MAKRENIFGVLGLFGGLGLLAYFTVGKRLKNISVGFSSISSNIKFSFPYLYVPVNIVLTNPDSQAITFQGLTGDVYINGTKSTELSVTKTVTLKAKSNTTISGLIIKSEVFTTLNTSLDSILTNKISISIKGTIKADSMSYPFTQELKLQ